MNTYKYKRIDIAEIVYLIYFMTLFGVKCIGLYEGMLLYNVALVLGMLLFGTKVLLTNHTVLEYIAIGILIGMSLLVYRNTGEKGLLLYMTMMLGMKGVSLARIEKWALMIVVTCFSVLTLASITGLIDGRTTTSGNRLFSDVMLRHYLGYPNCNVTQTTFVILMMLLILVLGQRNSKVSIISLIFIFIINIYIYIYTVSSTGLISSVAFILAYLVLMIVNKVGHFIGIEYMILYPFCMFISIGLPLLVKGDLFWKLDSILHNRMNYPHYWLTHEPITPFGVRFGEAPSADYYIDSSFLYSFLQLGVVPCIVLTALMMGMIYNLIRHNRRVELAVVFGLCILGLSDPFFYNLSYKNILFLFVGDLFYQWLEKLSYHLPSALKKEICILKIGMKEIDYSSFWMYRIWNAAFNFFGKVFSIKGSKHLLTFVISVFAIFAVSFAVVSPGAVVGAVNTLEEWEYFRKTLSIGVWSGLIIMFISAKIDISREKTIGKC